MNTKHEILSRREVPRTITSVGAITRKRVTETPVHAGEKMVTVRISSGFMAVGFGSTFEAAELDAVGRAEALAASAAS